MNLEDSYFDSLMKSNGFEVVNEKFIKFLNDSIKREKISIYVYVDYFEKNSLKFLEKPLSSSVAFMIDSSWLKLEKVDLVKLAGLNEFASDRLGGVMVSFGGNDYFPAVDGYNPFPVAHPENPQISVVNHPDCRSDIYRPSPMLIWLDKLFLSESDFKDFQYKQEMKKENKTPVRRHKALKRFLESQGYDLSKKLLRSEHNYRSRLELWKDLNDFDSKLFPNRGKDTVDKFFNGNPYISINKS